MIEKEVRCRVIGQANGPLCEDCKAPMDTIRVEATQHVLAGKEAHYCFPCTQRDRKRK